MKTPSEIALIRAAETARQDMLYAGEPWAELAKKAGFRPYDTESSARCAFRYCAAAIIEREAELIYLRAYGKDGAVWAANESKDVWRDKAALALGFARS